MDPDLNAVSELGCEVEPQALLSQYTTFRLGGACRCLIKCSRPEQLEKIAAIVHERRLDFIIIGRGSNILVSDQGVDGVVIRYFSQNPIIRKEDTLLYASASTQTDDLVLFAAEQGLAGLNPLSGIPGTLGGAIAGNAGAFGVQISDFVRTVTVLNPQGSKRILSKGDLDFQYRHSIFKTNSDVILEACFSLSPGNKQELIKERQGILETRKQKHPDYMNEPTAGSFFRNIEPTSKGEKRKSAGWFLEQSGAKDLSCGGAQVYPKHANIIVCRDNGTAQDVYTLAQNMSEKVKKAFGLMLSREVRYVGKFHGMPKGINGLIW